MSEYISKEEALKIVGFEEKWLSDTKSTNYDVDIAFHGLKKKIESAPSADVRPNTHGHWKKRTYIGNHETVTMNVCSECGKEFGWDIETGISIGDNNFCPNCGADMREPKGEKGTE